MREVVRMTNEPSFATRLYAERSVEEKGPHEVRQGFTARRQLRVNVDKVRCKELRHTEAQRGEHIARFIASRN